MPCGACLSFTKNNPQGELKNKQKRRLNIYLTKSRIVYGTKFIGAELQNLLKLFEYIMDYPGPAPAIKRRTAQHKQTLSIIY